MRTTVLAIAVAAVAVALAPACSQVDDAFYCDADYQCVSGDVHGFCILDFEVCAFFDNTCPGPDFLRYDETAGELAEVCVGDED